MPNSNSSANLQKSSTSTTRRRSRTCFTKQQLEELDKVFVVNPYPDASSKRKLMHTLGMSEQTIMIWFKNRRAKHRRAQKPNLLDESSRHNSFNMQPTYERIEPSFPKGSVVPTSTMITTPYRYGTPNFHRQSVYSMLPNMPPSFHPDIHHPVMPPLTMSSRNSYAPQSHVENQHIYHDNHIGYYTNFQDNQSFHVSVHGEPNHYYIESNKENPAD